MPEFRSLTDVTNRAQARISQVTSIGLYFPERIPFSEWYQADLVVVGRDLGVVGRQSYQVSVLAFVLCRMCDEADDIRKRRYCITVSCYAGVLFSVMSNPFPGSVLPALWFLLGLHYSLGLCERREGSLATSFQKAVKRLQSTLTVTSPEVVATARDLITDRRGQRMWQVLDKEMFQ